MEHFTSRLDHSVPKMHNSLSLLELCESNVCIVGGELGLLVNLAVLKHLLQILSHKP